MENKERIKIFIVDDHQMLIDGLKSLLKTEKKYEIIGEAVNGNDALKLMEDSTPDILLTDINMPGLSGLELTKIVRKKFPQVKIVALSMFGEKAVISDMLEAGVSGYILKNTGKEELIYALEKITSGGVFYSEEVSNEMMRSFSEKPDESTLSLTIREIEIVKLIAKEYSNIQIAEALFISERTVETHRKNIFRKTNAKSVVGLIKYAMEHKLI